jgi:hypothetical protein
MAASDGIGLQIDSPVKLLYIVPLSLRCTLYNKGFEKWVPLYSCHTVMMQLWSSSFAETLSKCRLAGSGQASLIAHSPRNRTAIR